jgi:hypothetical protein
LRRTHSLFSRMEDHSRRTARYFLTEANELTEQLDDDRLEAVAQVKTVRTFMLEEQKEKVKRQLEIERRVKELNKPVRFPLEKAQVEAIVKQSREKQQGSSSKLNRMLGSLYEYKAKANYATKMKVIKQYNQ